MKKFKRVISNNVYMLKLLCWAAPKKLWLNLLMTVWGCILQIISTVVFMRTLVNEIEAGKSFGNIVLFVLFMFAFQFVTQYSINIYDSFYLPSVNMDIKKRLQSMFYRKVATIDLACIENPEFFEGYIKANRYLWNKMDEVLNIIEWFALCNLTNTKYHTTINVDSKSDCEVEVRGVHLNSIDNYEYDQILTQLKPDIIMISMCNNYSDYDHIRNIFKFRYGRIIDFFAKSELMKMIDENGNKKTIFDFFL